MLESVCGLSLPEHGPLDDLPARVERGELNASEMKLAALARTRLAQLQAEGADPDSLATFVQVLSRLMVLKSAALVPQPAPPPAPPEDDDGPEGELAALLREYRQYKAVAELFRDREDQGLRSFPRLAPAPPLTPSPGLGNVTLDRLLAIVQETLRRRPPDPPGETARETVTVRERLSALGEALARDGRVSFVAFIGAARTRVEIVVSFMAVLELIKSGQATALQEEPFGDIVIVGGPASVAAPVD